MARRTKEATPPPRRVQGAKGRLSRRTWAVIAVVAVVLAATLLYLRLEPYTRDCDFDGISDGTEADIGTNACDEDTDGDDIVDPDEIAAGMDPRRTDTDGDGVPDGFEYANRQCMNPLVADAGADPDADNLTNRQEYQKGALACFPDSDADGFKDDVDYFPMRRMGLLLTIQRFDGASNADPALSGTETKADLVFAAAYFPREGFQQEIVAAARFNNTDHLAWEELNETQQGGLTISIDVPDNVTSSQVWILARDDDNGAVPPAGYETLDISTDPTWRECRLVVDYADIGNVTWSGDAASATCSGVGDGPDNALDGTLEFTLIASVSK